MPIADVPARQSSVFLGRFLQPSCCCILRYLERLSSFHAGINQSALELI